MRAVHVDRVLCGLWLVLLVVALIFGWPAGFAVFFAFAAGERWGVSWYR